MRHWNFMRLSQAKYMLRFSNEKIKTIGYKCGLGEPHYFSRVFRQMEGMSPLEYRENEYSCAVTPQVRQTGNRLSGLAGTAYASLLT